MCAPLRRPRPRPGLCPYSLPLGGPVTADGFSLVEVLIATGLLVTAIASVAQLFALATHANRASGDMTSATILAAEKIEELRAEPFPERPVDQSTEHLDASGRQLGGASAGERAYTRRWWIEPLSFASGDTVAITVGVSRYRRVDAGTPDDGGWPDVVRVVTLRTRRAP